MTEAIRPINMPKWGMTMTEGRMAGWLVKEGEDIAAGQEIMEIETEKITNVVESPSTGHLRRIVVAEGETAPVGALIGVLAAAVIPDADIDAFVASYADRAALAGLDEAGGPVSRLVEAGHGRINVLSIGEVEATPAVLIHGFGGDGGTWLFTQDKLADERPVHIVDLPAHGKSLPDLGAGSVDELASVVIATMDALGVTQAHLVGHSLGGAVALAIAEAAPERAASLSLIAPAGIGSDISGAYVEGFLAADRRKPMKDVLARLFASPGAMSAEMVESVLRSKRLDGVPEALAAIAANLAQGDRQVVDLRAVLENFGGPALIVWGGQDQIIPVAQAQTLPGSVHVEIIADAGHMPMMEAATTVNRLLLDHLSKADVRT